MSSAAAPFPSVATLSFHSPMRAELILSTGTSIPGSALKISDMALRA